MTIQRRRWLLGLAGLLLLILVWFAPPDEAPVVRSKVAGSGQRSPVPAAESRTERPRPLGSASGVMRPAQLLRHERPMSADATNIFKPTSWSLAPPTRSVLPASPPVPSAPPAQPAEPTAPSLPFVFLGQIVEEQKVQVILARGDRVVTVPVGESIDKNYRLESFTGGMLTFIYLPLDTRQTLATGISP
jgi:hypothetical protein